MTTTLLDSALLQINIPTLIYIIHFKKYICWSMVCDFIETSKMYFVMCVSAASLHRESSDYLLYKWCLVQSLVFMIFLGNTISIIFCTSNYKHVHSI